MSSAQNLPYQDAGCTVIYGADENIALGGNNEDFPDPFTKIWFLPPEDGKYGRAYVGYDGFIWQGGMNDQGLFFDAMSIENPVQVPQGSKPRYPGSLPDKAMSACADVDCVLDLFHDYHAYDTWVFQFMFGDASGHSVIIEPYTNLRGGAPFQIATNLTQSRNDINECLHCDSYSTARDMFEDADQITVELMKDILNAVHLEDGYPTQYSTVYDLNKGLIYLYHFHNFENVMIFDLADELAQGYHNYSLVDLFPKNSAFLDFAKPEQRRISKLRASFTEIELDPFLFEPYLGDFQGPDNLDMAFSYYSIGYKNGQLVLMMMPDKAWLDLIPISETSFFHVSSFYNFEITFLPGEDGEVNQFVYRIEDGEHLFTRVEKSEPVEEDKNKSETAWSKILLKLWRYSGTISFKFIVIILGLILLQIILQYLRSLLV
ncbi:MAG: hypothetical protein E4H33_03900 [Anaerolineales bacterium]|nr:MAG: hypothetical protein E4H33_03900 [Anaerolineales bacterium]